MVGYYTIYTVSAYTALYSIMLYISVVYEIYRENEDKFGFINISRTWKLNNEGNLH